MKIVVLDDNQYRHEAARSKWPDDEIVSCYTYSQLIDYLSTGAHCDIVSLDHDLGDFSTPDYGIAPNLHGYTSDVSTMLTGLDAAVWMFLNCSDGQIDSVMIHSANPVGTANMKDVLSKRWDVKRYFLD